MKSGACAWNWAYCMTWSFRQPFPGAGTGSAARRNHKRTAEAVRESDAILRRSFGKAGLDKKVWQYFTIVPDFRTGGRQEQRAAARVSGDHPRGQYDRCDDRLIEQIDWPVPDTKIMDRILKEVKNVNRVCYDLSPKPCATIRVGNTNLSVLKVLEYGLE